MYQGWKAKWLDRQQEEEEKGPGAIIPQEKAKDAVNEITELLEDEKDDD